MPQLTVSSRIFTIRWSGLTTALSLVDSRNRSHYSGLAKLLGAKGIASVQEELGAKVRSAEQQHQPEIASNP